MAPRIGDILKTILFARSLYNVDNMVIGPNALIGTCHLLRGGFSWPLCYALFQPSLNECYIKQGHARVH